MLEKIRRVFITTAMLATTLIVFVIYGIIEISNYRNIAKESDTLTSVIYENNGQMPEIGSSTYTSENKRYINRESPFSTRYFVVYFDDSGEITETNLKNISLAREESCEIARNVVNARSKTGFTGNYRYRVVNETNKTMVILVDSTGRINYFKTSLKNGFIIILIGLALVFIIIYASSSKAIKPMIENIKKQKQFITNVSYDLKTPIAVISADVEVLEISIGKDNEWVESIKHQTKRMDKLTKGMLNLLKIDNSDGKIETKPIDIVKVVKEEKDEIKVLAKNKNIKIKTHINKRQEENNIDEIKNKIFKKEKTEDKEEKNKTKIEMICNEDMIRKLITILLDNAIKYTPENGRIDIYIDEQKNNKAKMSFINDCKNVEKINTNRIFDRFYRGDLSRNNEKTEGFGIGLSMAKAIVEAHKGKIDAKPEGERISFNVII